ncbi:hypothetical protein TCE0_043r15526 [Talaromyces pinophilus]|uniref:Major facilitator superfamily (MFS) profile domain-containing protein n=1 Tax=Talaromyces pinophilus TaxID=128442 RepID=A0A0B8MY58_TALPI|nr:hypothetical protein TCE0_043r15526 [Talaromyces pinophilus]
MATVIIPMYSAEMAPKEIRRQLGSMFQFFFTLGVMTSYWMDYGVSMNFSATSKQWQIPVAFQLVPGGLLGLGRREEAMASLVWVRGSDSIEVQEEFAEIIAGIEDDQRATEGFTWKEFLLPANRYRMFVAVTMQIGVQLTGNKSLAYSSPQVFAAVGAGQQALLISGFFGVVEGLMLIFPSLLAVLTVVYLPKANAGLTSPAIASLTMIYLEAIPWLYMSEIFPTRLREGGIAIGTATQWLFNFVFSQITPRAVNNLGWRTFLMFCIFNWSLAVYSWLFIKETKGKSLKEMELVFNSTKTAIDFAKVHHDVQVMFNSDDQKESAKHVE